MSSFFNLPRREFDEKDMTIRDQPFVPPRFEFWRLMERLTANVAAVFIWVVGS